MIEPPAKQANPINAKTVISNPTDSLFTIASELNKVKKVKFFKKLNFSPALEIICINKNMIGSAVENPMALEDSLNNEEKKKQIPLMVNITINAPQFSVINVETSKSPGNIFDAKMIPNSVTMAISKKVETTRKMACVNQIFMRVFGVERINAIEPLSTLLAIKRLEMEIT